MNDILKSKKRLVKRRLSLRDNAIDKSVMKVIINPRTVTKKVMSSVVEIKPFKINVLDNFYKDSSIFILSALNKDDNYYKNLREPVFDDGVNVDFEKGFLVVKNSVNLSKVAQKIFFNLEAFVTNCSKIDDFDAYICGLYYGMKAYTTEILICMDDVFKNLFSAGLTKYESFSSYCDNLGFCDEIDGKKIVNEEKYTRGISDLLYKTKLLETD